MPFDGIIVKNIVYELNEKITGGRIEKVFQPENDEILINLRAKGQNLKLVLSANASFPRIHITANSKENPMTPPVFCMLLRKHISGGKIIKTEFFDYERIVAINIETENELGDTITKKLLIEIMGKHSNIILINENNIIIDAIKHIDKDISRVREVMPARPYILPPAQNKVNPETLNIDEFINSSKTSQGNIESFLLNTIKGFSPFLCRELCHISKIEGKKLIASLNDIEIQSLKNTLSKFIKDLSNYNFSPCVIYDSEKKETPIDFHSIDIKHVGFASNFNTISVALDAYYSDKDTSDRLKNKKSDIYKVLNNNIERCTKKVSTHNENLRESADRDKIKLFGELILANIYNIEKGAKKVSLLNYYSENEEYVDIDLDENILPQDNANRYFKKYTKAKSKYTNTKKLLEETLNELSYLESVLHLLDNCTTITEIDEVRTELINEGYIKLPKKIFGKKDSKISAPMTFKSSDGFEILVGKNNVQNDKLTLKISVANDIWLHTKDIPGSHVIIRKNQRTISDTAILEAAGLAAFYSKARMSSSVQVDYTLVKNVKKPSGAKPGMVIYTNFKTIIAKPIADI